MNILSFFSDILISAERVERAKHRVHMPQGAVVGG